MDKAKAMEIASHFDKISDEERLAAARFFLERPATIVKSGDVRQCDERRLLCWMRGDSNKIVTQTLADALYFANCKHPDVERFRTKETATA